MFTFFPRGRKRASAILVRCYSKGMNDLATLSREELIDLLKKRDIELQSFHVDLQSKDAELQNKENELETFRQQLRVQDMALQTNALTIEELAQDRDVWKLAYNKLLQDRFRHRSERYLDNPDQLRIDFGDTPAANREIEFDQIH